jgi:hypothetical protein
MVVSSMDRSQKKYASVEWTAEMDALLGTSFDTEVAKRIGTSKYHVRARRIELGISPFKLAPKPKSESPRKPKLVLTEAQKRKLGKVPDALLASRWGVSGGTVTRLRNSLGIAPFVENKEIEWTTGMLNLLGEISDRALAREYEMAQLGVKIKRIEMGILPFGKKHMDPEPELPRQVVRLIGKIPDKQISDKFKASRANIRIYRALHKIPPADYEPPSNHEWTSEDDALLGTISDGIVARRLKITTWQVHYRRIALGIAPFDRQVKVRWTAARVEQLGKKPDHLLAREWGYPQPTVREKREALGIAPCRLNARAWTKEEVAALGTVPDTVLARQLGLSQSAVAAKRRGLNIRPFKEAGPYDWKPQDLARLGKVPDQDLASELGLSLSFVAQKRKDLGIPVLRRSELRWTDDMIKKMGVVSDAKIAAELGCSVGLVQQKRNQLGIPSINAGG